VGTPKSGTTFLQRALWKNRDELRAVGVSCPGHRQQDMFHAAIEAREAFDYWGYDREQLAGTWHRLCRDAQRFSGTTVMSHELLSACTDEQVSACLADLDGLEVHVLVTVRDLAKQVTSEWQERVKNGSTTTFAKFQRRIEHQLDGGEFTSLFWRYQHVVGVLDRWAGGLPADRVHVVVAPRNSVDPTLLWRRFGEAVGFDAADLDPTTPGRANQTLGTAQVAVLRKVNKALDGRIKQPRYARIVKHQLAQQLLAAQPATKPVCPPELVERLRTLAEAQNQVLHQRGYRVYGDLADLVPASPDPATAAPDDVPAEDEVTAAVQAIADLLAARAARQARDGGAASEGPADAGSLLTRMRRRVGRSIVERRS